MATPLNQGGGYSILPPVTDPSTLPLPSSMAGTNASHETNTSGFLTSPPILPPVTPPNGPPFNQPTQQISIPPPLIGPIDDCMRSISVILNVDLSFIGPPFPVVSAIVFVNGRLRGTGTGSMVIGPLPFLKLPISVEVPIRGCCLRVGDVVTATMTINGITTQLSSSFTVESHEKYSYLTQQYNMQRTGWYPYEAQLNPNTDWTKFGIKHKLHVDGKVYAQPLYMHHQYFPFLGTAHNVVFIATENASVYAFDADTGLKLWQRTILPDGHRPVIMFYNSQTNYYNDIACSDIQPYCGISSTPVIDCCCHNVCQCESDCGSECGCNAICQTATMYVTSKSVLDSDSSIHWYLHALDVITGQERPNSPVEITGTMKGQGGAPLGNGTGQTTIASEVTNDGNGNILFNAKLQNSRPGLLLLNGTIYVAFASHCDHGGYFGWVISYDAITLQQKNIFCTTPDATYVEHKSPEGGIWQGNTGLASDGVSIYCTTGNGTFDASLSATDGMTTASNILSSETVDFTSVVGRPVEILGVGTFQISSVLSAHKVTLNGTVSNQSNLTFIVFGRDYGDSVLKLSQNLQLQSYFTPSDQSNLNSTDTDFGSGGVLILPDPQPGNNANLLVTCGKSGDIWVLDRNRLGGFAGSDTANPPSLQNNPNAVFVTPLQPNPADRYGGENEDAPGPWGGPGYFNNGPYSQYIFYCGNGFGNPGNLTAFQIDRGKLSMLGNSSSSFAKYGSTPIVSSNGQDLTSAIVWAVNRDSSNLHLRAYSASDLLGGTASELIDLHLGSWGPQPDSSTISPVASGGAFIEPLVINGKAYIAYSLPSGQPPQLDIKDSGKNKKEIHDYFIGVCY